MQAEMKNFGLHFVFLPIICYICATIFYNSAQMKRLFYIFSLLTFFAMLCLAPTASLRAQSLDTCFVGICIDSDEQPFTVRNNAKGEPSGYLMRDAQGNVQLYTKCAVVKVTNESTNEMRDKFSGEYRVITFSRGKATTYDYRRVKSGSQQREFRPTRVNNMQNCIYFRIDSVKSAKITFQLEKSGKMVRELNANILDQNSPKEALALLGGKPADDAPTDDAKLASATVPAKTGETAQTGEGDGNGGSGKGVLLTLLILAGIGLGGYLGYREYCKRKSESKTVGKQYVAAPVAPAAPVVAAAASAPSAPEVKVVEKIVKVPVEKIVEKIVTKEVPVEKIVEKIVTKEVPVEKIVEKIVTKEVPVEKIVEVPVEKIVTKEVEKIVEVPVEKIVTKEVEKIIDPNPELLKQIESLRVNVQQKQAELAQMQHDTQMKLSDMEQRSLRAKAEVLKQAQEQVENIQRNAQKQMAEAQQQLEEVKQVAAAQLAEANEAAAQQLAEANQNAAQQLAELKQVAAAQLAEANQNAAAQLAETKEAAAAQLAEANQNAAAQLAAAQEAAAQQIAEVQQEARAQVEEAQQKSQQVAEAASQDIEQYKLRMAVLEERISQPLDSNRKNLKASLMLIAEHIQLLKDNVEQRNADNNYHNTTTHMAIKFEAFLQWFEKNVMKDEEGAIQCTGDLYALMQNEFRSAIENNYSWVSELLRINAYSAISPLFLTEAKRSGILIEDLHIAVAETIGLLGKYGITMIIPHLFVDDFDVENYKLNNAPLINSFYPHGFKEQEMAKRGVIYDVIRPGYSVDGVLQKVPEVSAMMAVTQ